MDGDDLGGNSACWLSNVCPECGALLDDLADLAEPCRRCGRTIPGDQRDGAAVEARTTSSAGIRTFSGSPPSSMVSSIRTAAAPMSDSG